MKKVAIITGGAKGIGKATSLSLAKQDIIVIINYNNSETSAKNLVNEIINLGYQAESYKCSVTDKDNLQKMFDYIKDKYGHIDILINNAGITKDGFLMTTSTEDIENTLNTNIMGTMLCSKLVIPYMISKKSGKIINISSVAGIKGIVGQTSYSASKSAILGFTRSLAIELSKFNIQVNSISPGYIDTDMTKNLSEKLIKKYIDTIPMKRFGNADEIAYTVEWLCSDKCSYITGQNIVVDGGISII